MNKKTRINNKGFTLMELIVSMAIASFVILAAYSFVMLGTKNYERTNKTTSLQQEVSFTNNLIAESIRAAKKDRTSITYSGGLKNVELHTGSKVLYYDAAAQSLYIYEELAGSGVGDAAYTSNTATNLVSDNIVEFEADYVATESGMTPSVYSDDIKVDAYSNLIKITMKVNVKGKTDTSEVIYQIRNNS